MTIPASLQPISLSPVFVACSPFHSVESFPIQIPSVRPVESLRRHSCDPPMPSSLLICEGFLDVQARSSYTHSRMSCIWPPNPVSVFPIRWDPLSCYLLIPDLVYVSTYQATKNFLQPVEAGSFSRLDRSFHENHVFTALSTTGVNDSNGNREGF